MIGRFEYQPRVPISTHAIRLSGAVFSASRARCSGRPEWGHSSGGIGSARATAPCADLDPLRGPRGLFGRRSLAVVVTLAGLSPWFRRTLKGAFHGVAG
jgi:hypothetical protein